MCDFGFIGLVCQFLFSHFFPFLSSLAVVNDVFTISLPLLLTSCSFPAVLLGAARRRRSFLMYCTQNCSTAAQLWCPRCPGPRRAFHSATSPFIVLQFTVLLTLHFSSLWQSYSWGEVSPTPTCHTRVRPLPSLGALQDPPQMWGRGSTSRSPGDAVGDRVARWVLILSPHVMAKHTTSFLRKRAFNIIRKML